MNYRTLKWLLLWALTSMVIGCGGVQGSAFLTRSNMIMAELAKPSAPYVASDTSLQTHHMPFFEDSYGVRALCGAYRADIWALTTWLAWPESAQLLGINR